MADEYNIDVLISINDKLNTNKNSLASIETILTNLLNDSFGQNGGVYIDDTNPATPATGYNFIAMQAIEDTVVSAAVGNITNIAGITISTGTIIYGTFTSITLTSGSVIAYQG